MIESGSAPFTHGMEVEQFPHELPPAVTDDVMSNQTDGLTGWEDDASGPRETSIGPFKNAKSILNRFYAGTRDRDITWEWHATDGSRGAGSHVHLCLSEDLFDRPIPAWTIAYNTAVEMFPFFAPYFCHDWQRGFRGGVTDYTGDLAVEHYAAGQLTRLSRSSIREKVNDSRSINRSFRSVTFNPQMGEKPVTVELRANDGHPAMALPGLLQIRRLAGRAIEGGWSPKLTNHRATLRRCYKKIYGRATDVGLLTAMREPLDGGIEFEEGRGIPGVDQLAFETMFDVLRAVQIAQPETPNTWTCRAYNLVRAGDDGFSPSKNPRALWNMDGASGHFRWESGPQDSTSEVK